MMMPKMLSVLLAGLCLSPHLAFAFEYFAGNRTCTLEPLGSGQDDTNQVCHGRAWICSK